MPAGAVVVEPAPPAELPLAVLDARVVVVVELELELEVLETPAAPPPFELPGEELFVVLDPGLVALGVLLAGWIDVVVGTPPPPQALSSVALAANPAARSFL